MAAESKTPWTPGPWEVCNTTDVFTLSGAVNAGGIKADDNDGWHVADCSMGQTFVAGACQGLFLDEMKANARLISKAPELVEAVEKLMRELSYELGFGGHTDDACFSEYNALLQQVRGD